MATANLSENIANRIKHRIIVGKYGLGTQLPTEAELCESLNVSRTTIREAIKILVSKNILKIERGIGTFVAVVPGLSEDPFGLEFVSDDILKTDLCTFRNIVEPKVCALAAQNATQEQIDIMADQVTKMKEISLRAQSNSVDEWIDEFIEQEIAFHVTLYKMSGNVLFERMGDVISRSVIINCTGMDYRQTFDFDKYCELHTTLYAAISQRDAGNAERLGISHCEGFSQFL